MNVLITSISAKVPLIRAARSALKRFAVGGLLYGADSNPDVVGRYFVDAFWEMPPLSGLKPECLLAYCSAHQITRVIPTRNEDLLFFSQLKDMLAARGIRVMVSDRPAIEQATDKFAFYRFGRVHGFPVITTARSPDELGTEHYAVKERYGAGAKKLALNVTRDEAVRAAECMHAPLYQPFIAGKEFSIDLYLDVRRHVKGVVSRRRLVVKDGESQVTRTTDEPELERLAGAMAHELDLYGHVMFQMIKSRADIYIVECNPRFGGASTLSVAAGLDSFYWFLRESSGKSLDAVPFKRQTKSLTLIRYPQDLIR
ncbi:MAG: ATP-grasp domain-containing protein [Sporolactobacillus sp.]|nr:ATP-grasp domain-containing protein [Sporolactobacillus sp.]